MRFDRFTIRGQEAVQAAIGVAEKQQNQQVEPEHILAAMLEQKEGVLKPILGKIGANATAIAADIQASIDKMPKVTGGQQYFSSRTNTLFQEVQKIAEKMQDEYVSTEHLLLSIASEKDGDAGRILRSNGVTREDLETVITEM
ncbi:MAG TPA: Clp protease N-terminal domain-containing protein, partial [Pyrinomonadaceae bacterium]|nr:Clp protease N-terminal domain-containing protein [Pyrinomonadaceae bacterium]